MVKLLPVVEADAEALFPLIYHSSVTEMLIWDGPSSLEEFRDAMRDRAEQTRAGTLHAYTIVQESDGAAVGMIRIAPDASNLSGDIGLWIGAAYHGRGYGTEAIRQVVEIGFEQVGLHRLEARVFVGNMASRRAFEKNGFALEGTLREIVRKRGRFLDEWVFGKVNGLSESASRARG